MNPDSEKTIAGLITGFFLMVGGWFGMRGKKAEIKKAEVEADVKTNQSDNDRAVHEQEIEAKQYALELQIQNEERIRQVKRIEHLENSLDIAHGVVSDLQDKIMLLFDEKSNLRTQLIELKNKSEILQTKDHSP